MINKVCDLALTAAYTADSHIVDARHVAAASEELVVATLKGCRHAALMPEARDSPRVVSGRRPGAAHHDHWLLCPYPPPAARGSIAARSGSGPRSPGAGGNGRHRARTFSRKRRPPRGLKSGSYILQLGSYNTVDSTLRAIAIYARKGIDANWSAIDLGEKGVWYRVFSGRYASRREALQYQQDHQLIERSKCCMPPGWWSWA
jgi:hypothetical protein